MPDLLIIFCAKYVIYISALALAAYWVLAPKQAKIELAIALVIALPLTYALARLAGLFISHVQPFAAGGYEPLISHEVDNSFPSDHSALAGALAGVAGFYNKYLSLALWLLALLVAMGRVLSGLHYPVDAAAGLMLGGLCGALAAYGIHLYFSARAHTG